MAIDFRELPSPFYRVAVKVIVRDSAGRVLVVQNNKGTFELPGGGWEFSDESLEACVERELQEELGVGALHISGVVGVFRGVSSHGSRVVRLVVEAELASQTLRPGDGVVAFRFVTKEEFASLPLVMDDRNATYIIGIMWPPIEKNAAHL